MQQRANREIEQAGDTRITALFMEVNSIQRNKADKNHMGIVVYFELPNYGLCDSSTKVKVGIGSCFYQTL